MAMKNRPLVILGTGSYLPSQILSNDTLEDTCPTSAQWIENTLGIKERRISKENENTVTMATEAAKRAIAHAHMLPEDLDLIIVATATPPRIGPSAACMVQKALCASNAVAFDLNAVCAGFLYALSVASELLSNGRYRKIMVIGADRFSRITNWHDRNCVFFGDGAGAAIIGLSEDPKAMFVSMLHADGRGGDAWTVPEHEWYYRMDGKAVFQKAMEVLPATITEVCYAAGVPVSHIDYIVPHQPSIGILKALAQKLDIPFERVLTNLDRYANTSAATIPILLDENNRVGKFKAGNIVVFAAIGSGWAWGAAVMRWTLH